MILFVYHLKTSDVDVMKILDAYHATLHLCICLHLIKIIKGLDSPLRRKRLFDSTNGNNSILLPCEIFMNFCRFLLMNWDTLLET